MVQATPSRSIPSFSAHHFRWNRAGRFRLGKVIQASIEHNRRLNAARGLRRGEPGWRPDTIRGLSQQCSLQNHVSLGNIIRGTTQSLRKEGEEILRAIAPYIYRLVRFEIERGELSRVVLDYTETYADRWKDLARIGEEGEKYDYEITIPANLSVDDAAQILETIQRLYKFVPTLEALVASGNGKTNPSSIRQCRIMSEQEGISEVSRSFRAAAIGLGLSNLPERLEEEDEDAIVISRLLKMEVEGVVALYNGDRLPSVDEVEEVLSGLLCHESGDLYTLRELLDIIDPLFADHPKNGNRERFH